MAGWREYTESRVAVPGGELAVLRWKAAVPDAPVLLLAHGITANALVWASVAEEIDGRAEVIAPDLRGRAGSRGITGPWASPRTGRTSSPCSTRSASTGLMCSAAIHWGLSSARRRR